MSSEAPVAVVAAVTPKLERTVVAALVGRQNAGKTSLLMHVTGSAQHPVNFPGSSVERSEASTRVGDTTLRVVDLPGITSLEAISPDEDVALKWLTSSTGEARGDRGTHGADVICAVVDASKLAVELALVRRLAVLGRPIVVALTKRDIAPDETDVEQLAARIGLLVVPVNALTGVGARAVRDALVVAGGGGDGERRALDSLAKARRGSGSDPEAGLPADFDPIQVARAVQRPADPAQRRRANRTDRIDAVVLHRVFGLPILALVLVGIFELLFVGAEPAMGLIEAGQGALGDALGDLIAPGALRSFLIDGLVNGLGSTLIFLPQIIFLMCFVSLLEASGYMARAAFLLDRILSKVGLSGRSFVPIVSSFACAVPGILATRTIENERERLATIAILPLMSCSARLPVYVVLIGAFFPSGYAGLVLFAMYALGVVIATLVAWILRKTKLRGTYSVLMMELPAYQRPSGRVVFHQVWSATRQFMVTAGTIIVTTSIVIWVLSYYPRPESIHLAFEAERAPIAAALAQAPDSPELSQRLAEVSAAERAAYLEQSALATMGKFVAPVFAPAGMDWRTTVGVLAAFPARELIIPTLGILHSLGDVDPGSFSLDDAPESRNEGLRGKLRAAKNEDGSPAWSPLVALSVMVFFALCSQCAATLGTIRRETRSWRWPAFVFGYMTGLAWIFAVLVYQIGSALGFGGAA